MNFENDESLRLPSKRIVVCGSMSFINDMKFMRVLLEHSGVETLVPEADNEHIRYLPIADVIAAKRASSMRHIRRIRDQKTYAVLVLNQDKHGVHDYIGPNTFAEIAVAMAHYKRIFLWQSIPHFYEDELEAWGVCPLHQNIDSLVKEYNTVSRLGVNQLTLF